MFVIYSRLSFARTAVSNGIVDYAIAIAALPLVILTFVCAARALRHLLALVWFSPLGVQANHDSLQLVFGPFGNVSFPSRELEIRYPFEMSGDFDDGGFEQYLPEDEQTARLLPRITHPRARVVINRTILRFVTGDEARIVVKLKPVIDRWRAQNSTVQEFTG